MKKSTIVCIFCFLISNYNAYCQTYTIQPKHGIELQFGANSPVISLKYNRIFWLNSNEHITASVGSGLFFGVNFNQDLTYSIGNGHSFWEVGLLGTYTSSKFDYRTDYKYYVLPMTGFKYISSSWFSTRLHFAPYIEKGEIYPYGGIAISFHFREKYIEPKQSINTVRYRKE